MKYWKTLLFILVATTLRAQYFQQSVDYRIIAELDDTNYTLHASLELDYTNNAPKAISEIYFHLWPNAFKSDNTAFARQKRRDNDLKFHFSEETERGRIDSLNFMANGSPLTWSIPDPNNPDIALVKLAKPLAKNATITISTPFRVKVPASFSRLGHVGDAYQMTQWYPKPAVYDQDGWHPMPYLDRGEFYSEFGSFDVTITLPENYVVGATGVLQNKEERDWLINRSYRTEAELNKRQDLSTSFVSEAHPPSAKRTKTIRYLAEKVHDFAWFADKRFKVLHQEAYASKTEQRLDFWAFFTETEAAYWKNSLIYLEHAIEFYSEKIGMYPYPQVTAVQSALSAGSGMEYPMITVIGRNASPEDLDEVLAHEVGHNWFYGILATNERTHPWMDEGFNSYYERLYMEKFYPEWGGGYTVFNEEVNIDELGYRYQNRVGAEQSPDMDSDSMAINNYWLNAYSKPDLALQYLDQRYGAGTVDLLMKAYFEKHQFTHPAPATVQAVFEEALGANLDWLFKGFLMSDATVDFSLEKGRAGKILVKKRGDINPPVAVKKINSPDEEIIFIDDIPPSGYELPAGNYELLAGPLDLNPGNNFIKRSLEFSLLTKPEATDGSRQLFFSPLVGINAEDGLMLGVGVHNRTLEPKQLEFLVAPLYGFKSSSVVGFGGLQWRLPKSLLPTFANTATLSGGYQRFASRSFRKEAYHYGRFAGQLTYNLRHPVIDNAASSISAQFIHLNQAVPDFNGDGELIGKGDVAGSFYRLNYQRIQKDPVNPRQLLARLEYGNPGTPLSENFAKAELTLTGGYQFRKSKFFRWRVFAGYFIQNKLRERNTNVDYAFSLVGNAASDYANDDLYFGRGDDRTYGQQLSERMGGFRSPINSAFGVGRSNNYLLSLNLDAHLPFTPMSFPLGVFVDAAVYDRSPIRAGNENAFQYAAGLSLTTANGKVGLYAPLFSSDAINNTLEQRNGFLQRLSFRLSLTNWLPWKIMDNISL